MQRDKVKNKNSELQIILDNSEKLTSSLAEVMNKFQLKRSIKVFDFLKCKGIAVSSLLSILIILPFYGFSNICHLMRCGLSKLDFEGKKTTFYDTKNNEFLDCRTLLKLHAKRFIYLINNNIHLKSMNSTALIFDDTAIEKTGKKIEKVSMVHDHTSQRFILGFKLLVCGFWDGGSFIPIDFTLHREKGNKQKKLIEQHSKAKKQLSQKKNELDILKNKILKSNKKLIEKKELYLAKPLKINKLNYENLINNQIKLEQQEQQLEKEIIKLIAAKDLAYKKLKHYYSSDYLFGLSAKERKEQFKKSVSTKSHGFTRRKEADKSKIDCMLDMLSRTVRAGVVPNYVLVDSWFFCFKLLQKLSNLRKGAIKLISMVKINSQKFTICATDKEMSVKSIIKLNERKAKRCKKLKARYIRVNCLYKGIRVNLFFVKMGRSSKWHLLLTTDLKLSFITLIETYQIRWSIEVFFKESKQYLGLSDCRSNTFDAQIADITISMMQNIMLSYFKRINYQQSIGGLFESISAELVELDLVTRLLEILTEMIKILCDINGIDFIEFQENMIKDDTVMQKFIRLLPEKKLSNVA